MNHSPKTIRLLDPASQAFERMKDVLFRPFDLSRWIVIGFCAWLATLGESWGGGGGGGGSPGGGGGRSARDELNQAMEYVRDNLNWIIPLAVGIVVLIVVVGLLILWLSSRGRFMFLHNVATNRAEVVVPWNEYQRHGNSLFLFRVALAIGAFVAIVPLVVVLIAAIVRMILREEANPGGIALAVLAGLGAMAAGLVFAVIEKLTKDFVVPIMRLRAADCVPAWREFLGLLGSYPLNFTLYLLFHLALSMAIGVLTIAAVLVTCCVAGCLLAIPYVGTVLFLPVLVFLRAFSLCYLAQYGPDYDVFPPGMAMAPSQAPGPLEPTTPPPDTAPGTA